MPSEPKRDGRGALVAAIGLSLIVVPLLYVLSVGPAARAAVAGILPESIFEVLYAPLEWLRAVWPAFHDATDWYAQLWS